MPEVSSTHGNGRILVVDGEPHIQRLLGAVLSSEGYEVATAVDGIQGLDTLAGTSFDLVILDLAMPGAGGLEILSKIRSAPRHAETPVIILASKGQDTDRETALAGGANDFLSKPFSPKKLLARIDEILGRS